MKRLVADKELDILALKEIVGVTLDCVASGSVVQFTADSMIDGTGAKSVISEKLDLRVQPDDLDTPLSSRAIFSHFEDVKLIEEVFDDECVNDRLTVKRELSTQHHMFDGGWLWFIPFDNGVTSRLLKKSLVDEPVYVKIV